MSKNLSGKVALVTGGSRGIGAATARALAESGADVAISYSASPDKAEGVVRDLTNKGVRAAAFKADQANKGEVERSVAAVPGSFRRDRTQRSPSRWAESARLYWNGTNLKNVPWKNVPWNLAQ